MTYQKEGPACGKIPCDPTSSEARPCQQSCRDGLRISALTLRPQGKEVRLGSMEKELRGATGLIIIRKNKKSSGFSVMSKTRIENVRLL